MELLRLMFWLLIIVIILFIYWFVTYDSKDAKAETPSIDDLAKNIQKTNSSIEANE